MSTSLILNSLSLGALLMVLSSGLALIYGLRGVVNFAHGSLYMLGAYLSFSVASITSFWVGLIAAPVALGTLGFLLDRFGLRYLTRRTELELVLVTFGLSYVLNDLVLTIWGPSTRSVSPPTGLEGITVVLGASYPTYRLFLIAASLLLVLGLGAWIRYSSVGLHVRAASTDREIAGIVGVNVDRTSAVVVSAGAALAGVAGALATPVLSLFPSMGLEILVTTFLVIVIGGLGSVAGAAIAAMLLAALQTFGAVHAPSYSATIPYVLVVLVLLFRPQGIAGKVRS